MWDRLKYNKASINKDHKDIRDDINKNLVDSGALIDSKLNEENQHNWEKFFKENELNMTKINRCKLNNEFSYLS